MRVILNMGRNALENALAYWYETRFDINTGVVKSLVETESVGMDASKYAAASYRLLRRLRLALRPSSSDVFIDLGCGMGRALFYFAHFKMKRIVGVEFDRRLCEICQRNIDLLPDLRSPILLVQTDAARHEFTEETLIFMHNPFGTRTLQRVLSNIQESALNNPRQITVIWGSGSGTNPECAKYLDSLWWLKPFGDMLRYRLHFYRVQA